MESKSSLTVNFFRTDSGNEPVREWLREMEKEEKKTIGADIKTVQDCWASPGPDVIPDSMVKKIEPGLWEIRSKLGSGTQSRIFFTVRGNRLILLHGFIKKSQKTPQKEIELARRRRNQWLREESEG